MQEQIEQSERLILENICIPNPLPRDELVVDASAHYYISAIPKRIQFCDELGYDVVPIKMFQVTNLNVIESLIIVKDKITLSDNSQEIDEKGNLNHMAS